MKKLLHGGFTLIELMITVAIIAILAGVAYPSYRNQVMRSNRSEAKNALLQLQLAQEKYFLQFGRYAGSSCNVLTEMTNSPKDTTTPGLGIPARTPNGLYTICLVRPTTTSFTATATAAGAQTGDTDCRTFSITETGDKDSTNSSGSSTMTKCWK